MIQSLEELYDVIKILRSDEGCPWDKAQTMQSLDKLFLEECYELSDAIQINDQKEISEELGDVSFMLLLMSHISEQDEICHLPTVYQKAKEKLIFRHPHVFGNVNLHSTEEVLANWEQLKKKEKQERSSIFDGIPRSLPDMMRFDKLMRKLSNNSQDPLEYQDQSSSLKSQLKNLLIQYHLEGINTSQLIQEINQEIEQQARQQGL